MKKAIFGALCALALVGCGGGSGGGGSSPKKARVAYVNASPDAGSLSFRLNGDEKAVVPFGTSSDFGTATPARDLDVSVRPDGGAEVLWAETHTFPADSDSLVVAVGLRTPFQDDTQTPPVVENAKRLVLSFAGIDRTPPTGNRARLFVVHGFVRQQGFPTPIVEFRNPGNTPLVSLGNLGFGSITSATVDSGAQTFQVRQNGTEQEYVTDTNFTLGAGKVYVALVSGIEGTSGATAPKISLIPLETREP